MGNHEAFEANKKTESVKDGGCNSLSSYAMERGASRPHGGADQHNNLVEAGILPAMNFTCDYPTGVKVETSPPPKNQHGNVIIEGSIMVQAEPPNHMTKNGEVVDPKGKVLAKMNDDGSVTVDSGKGFYTHRPDGSVERESVIRSRDGKTFEVIDTKTPLGNLRPGDVVKPSH
jgi:hypothetical protein